MQKFLIIIILIMLLAVIILFGFYQSYIKDDKEFCLDTGRCVEGLEINTEYGRIKINKENCVKYGWQWDDEKKWCNTRN